MPENADLGQDLEAYVDELVRSGLYPSRDEVLKDGVRLLKQRDTRKRDLDAALARGLAQSEAGLGTPIEEVAERLKAKYSAMAQGPARKASR